ncbi:MAG: Uma2 family endonuclease [Eubacterium sp.]|nr:Uma2 family endonuclease [Eubacterium sp.]
MTIEEMQTRKRELGYTYETISELSGVPLPTVQKVLGGITRSPRFETIKALEKVLGLQEWEIPVPNTSPGVPPGCVRETGIAYAADPDGTSPLRMPHCYPLLPFKNQGDYTAEDRELLPEEVRTELIDGVLYDMASPLPAHQIIVGEVYKMLSYCIERTGRNCYAFISPSDLWINRDNKTVLQPDIYVICDFSMVEEKAVKGAPPLVIEVLSPSTRSRDMLLKAYKYVKAGVKEFWEIDPKDRWVRVYDYDKDPTGTKYEEYGFDKEVPVRISEGSCTVDFRKVADILDKMLG